MDAVGEGLQAKTAADGLPERYRYERRQTRQMAVATKGKNYLDFTECS